VRITDPTGTTAELDGHRIGLTNLDRVVYPATGTTKAEVIRYYLAIAAVMVPHVRDRPTTRRRWPDGVAGQVFYERNLPDWAPRWLRTVRLEHSDRTVTYPVPRERADLVWFAQSGALELHTPQWRVGPRGARRKPDRLVLDLDPGAPAGLAECAALALRLRERLAQDGAVSVPVTSGSKGIQVYASWPLPGQTTSSAEYARRLAEDLAAETPGEVVATMTRRERGGKVLLDWSQNNPSKTTIAPYSLRGRETPTVAAPRTWSELESGDIEQLTFDAVLERAATSDPLQVLVDEHPT
jgi:bifunctional non-homologous end joining protein LigD